MTEKFIKSLSGHSGCQINLMQTGDGDFFVRKISGTKNYNVRLRVQMVKQARFPGSEIKAPNVINSGVDENGLFWFDMQYLNCQTFAHYMSYITVREIAKMIDILMDELHVADSHINPEANKIFHAKIESLRKNIPDNKIYVSALDRLDKFDFSQIPESLCHGDLTLENILIDTDNNVYLIDFLDSFFNSWMVDAAKLLQDLELGWSYRYDKMSPNLQLRLLVAKEALIGTLSAMPNGRDTVIKVYYILLLNVMRIVPYAHDDVTKEFLEKSIEKLNNILDTKEMTK